MTYLKTRSGIADQLRVIPRLLDLLSIFPLVMLAGVDLIAFQPFQVLVLIVAFSLRQIVVVVSTLHVLGQPSILLGNLSHIAQIRLFYRLSEETKGNKSILKVLITQRGGRQWP